MPQAQAPWAYFEIGITNAANEGSNRKVKQIRRVPCRVRNTTTTCCASPSTQTEALPSPPQADQAHTPLKAVEPDGMIKILQSVTSVD